MKGSVKSRLNYADIHQNPVVKRSFHKILRLLSAVTNEGSHPWSPGGQQELGMSLSPRCEHWLTFPELLWEPCPTGHGSGLQLPRKCPPLPSSSRCWELTALIQISTQLPSGLFRPLWSRFRGKGSSWRGAGAGEGSALQTPAALWGLGRPAPPLPCPLLAVGDLPSAQHSPGLQELVSTWKM